MTSAKRAKTDLFVGMNTIIVQSKPLQTVRSYDEGYGAIVNNQLDRLFLKDKCWAITYHYHSDVYGVATSPFVVYIWNKGRDEP